MCSVYSLLPRLEMMIFLYVIKKKKSLIQQSNANMGLSVWEKQVENARLSAILQLLLGRCVCTVNDRQL